MEDKKDTKKFAYIAVVVESKNFYYLRKSYHTFNERNFQFDEISLIAIHVVLVIITKR